MTPSTVCNPYWTGGLTHGDCGSFTTVHHCRPDPLAPAPFSQSLPSSARRRLPQPSSSLLLPSFFSSPHSRLFFPSLLMPPVSLINNSLPFPLSPPFSRALLGSAATATRSNGLQRIETTVPSPSADDRELCDQGLSGSTGSGSPTSSIDTAHRRLDGDTPAPPTRAGSPATSSRGAAVIEGRRSSGSAPASPQLVLHPSSSPQRRDTFYLAEYSSLPRPILSRRNHVEDPSPLRPTPPRPPWSPPGAGARPAAPTRARQETVACFRRRLRQHHLHHAIAKGTATFTPATDLNRTPILIPFAFVCSPAQSATSPKARSIGVRRDRPTARASSANSPAR